MKAFGNLSDLTNGFFISKSHPIRTERLREALI